VPKLPSGLLNPLANGQGAPVAGQSKRIASQTAAVFNTAEGRRQGSLDGLNVSMHYVNTLGENLGDATFPAAGQKENAVSKIVVTAGEDFKFRVNVKIQTGQYPQLEARLTSGEPLPQFLQLDLMSYGGDGTSRKAVEFYGLPNSNEIGEYSVGVYATDNKEAVANVIVRVKGRGGS
jgi:axial budding pattern protein 2